MEVLTPWSYLYLIFILPPLLLFSLILKDRMSTAALPARPQRYQAQERQR